MMKKYASLAIVAAAILWGMIGYFTTTMKNAGMTTFQNVSARSTAAALSLILATLVKDPKRGFRVSLKDLLLLFACGTITLTVNNIFYFTSIERSGLSVAAVLMYTAPIFVMILSALIYKEKITRKKVLALIITFAGCVLVSLTSEKNPADAIGILGGLGAGLTYALYSIFANGLMKRYSSLTVVMYTYLFAAISSYFVTTPVGTFAALYEHHQFFNAILLGVFCSSLAHFLYSLGMKYTEPSTASIIATLELVAASVVGFLVFGQSLAWYNYIGILLVLTAVVLLNLRTGAKRTTP